MKFLEVYPELKVTTTFGLVKKRYPKHANEVMETLFTVYSPYSTVIDMDFEERSKRALEVFIPQSCDFNYNADKDLVDSYLNDVLDTEARALIMAKKNLDTISRLMIQETNDNLLDVKLKSNFDRHKEYDKVLSIYQKIKKDYDTSQKTAATDSTVLKGGMNLSWRDQRLVNFRK